MKEASTRAPGATRPRGTGKRFRASGVVFLVVSLVWVLDDALSDSESGMGPVHRFFPDLGATGLARGGYFEVVWAFIALVYLIQLWIPEGSARPTPSPIRAVGRLAFTLAVVLFFCVVFYMMALSSGTSSKGRY